MTQNKTNGNNLITSYGTTAPLTNVGLCFKALHRAVSRPAHLPGMVCFYGPSGWGKSTAAAYVTNRLNAYYIECKSSWTRKAILNAILNEMGIIPENTIYQMADQVYAQLMASGRPLIIDEMDYMVSKGAVELIRDIYEGSKAAILLIGEERLPKKLERWERFHGRVLDWVPAQPADIEDTIRLAQLYCRKVEIGKDLLKRIHQVSRGSVRRICVNLELVQDGALTQGLASIELADWDNQKFFTGEAPARRI